MKPSSIKKVRHMYEDFAENYSQSMDQEIQLPMYMEVLGNLHQAIEGVPGIILDTACGPGHMLALYREKFDSKRELAGIDLSPRMTELAARRLEGHVTFHEGDMRQLTPIGTESVAALINYFALHHLEASDILISLKEWHRVLCKGGHLLIATWEGEGTVDYGEDLDIVGLRYEAGQITELAQKAGFTVTGCRKEPFEEFPMDALILEGRKP